VSSLKSLVDIEGFDKLQKQLMKLSNDKSKKREIIQILKQFSKPTKTAAQRYVPVQSSFSNIKSKRTVLGGSLRASIKPIVGKKGNSRINPTVYIGPRVYKGKKTSKAGRNVWGDGWYGHMVDQGHDIYGNSSNRGKKKKSGKAVSVLARVGKRNKGNVVGRVPGAFFMKKAYQLTKGKVTNESASAVARYFQKKINKLSK